MNKSLFYKVRLVYFFYGSRILPDCGSYRTQSHRTSFKLIDNSVKYLVVYGIKTALVYVKSIQSIRGYLYIYKS